MKILNIKIENIASLKGSHSIDFESFGESNSVFAITGETGSGKSTILNAISLSLYGQNYKKNLNQIDFITLGESEGLIELKFKIQNKTYKATWSCRLKKSNGEDLKTPKPRRELFEYVKNKWIAQEYLPEQILNLNFDQFCKTMILNQGEFAKFLTSTFKERKDILERFYNGEKLELLSVKTRQKINKINQDIENQSFQIAGLTEHSLKDEQAMKTDIESNEFKMEIFKSQNKLLNSTADKIKEIINATKDLNTNSIRVNKISIDINDITTEKNRIIKEHENIEKKLKEHQLYFTTQEPLLIKCRDIDNKNKLLQAQNNQNQIELKEIEIKLEDEIKHHQSTKHEILTIQSKLKDDRLSKLYLNTKLDSIQILIDLEAQRSQIATELKMIETEISIVSTNLEEIENEANLLKIQKNKYDEFLKKNTLIKIESHLEIAEQNKDDYQKALNSYENIFLRMIELEDINQKDNVEKEEIEFKIKKCKELYEQMKERAAENEAALKYYKLSESIELCRHESKIEGTCVVCNSNLDSAAFIDSVNLDSSNLKKIQSSKISIQDQLLNIQSNILTEEAKIESIKKSSEQNYMKNLQLKDEFIKGLPKEIQNGSDIESIEDLKSYKKRLIQKLAEAQRQMIKETTNKDLFNETMYKIESSNNEIQAYRERYKKQFEKQKKLLNSKNETSQKIKPISDEIHLLLDKKEIPTDLMASLLFSKDFLQNEEQLNNKKNELNKQQDRISILKNEIKNKTDIIKGIDLEITNNIQYIKESIKEKDPDTELKSLKIQKLQIDDKLKVSNEEMKNSEITLAQKSSQLKGYKEQIEHVKNQLKISFKEIKDQIKTYQEVKIDESYIEEELLILNDYKRFVEKLSSSHYIENFNMELLIETNQFNLKLIECFKGLIEKINTTITENKTLLKESRRSVSKVQEINKYIETKQNEKSQLEDLYSLVGRDEFRNYVLSIIEKRLITQTNKEIKQLCDDRYKIIHLSKANKMAPDFFVIDRYKAGLTRKISTLSGGETFMVSLAMAMALSELSRGNNEIDSFFIDEGFGTLDEDSLEDVLEMINNIQSRGKSIGLITHVKKLADRIAINIHLEKSKLGNSTIKIRYQ